LVFVLLALLIWVEYFVSLEGSDISSREGSLGGGSFYREIWSDCGGV
jgi:hypothetical protein